MPRLLSIEDDADLQHMIAIALRKEGYEVHYAFNGKEGYEKTVALNPDLVLLDMMLPVMNGAELIRMVRADRNVKDTPIIVMTSYSDDVSLLESSVKALGVLEYLRKPVHIPELLLLIKQILAAHSHNAALPERVRKGSVSIDPKFRTVWVDGNLVATLPFKRFHLLKLLLDQEGEVPKEKLVKTIWGETGSVNVLEKTVQRLREDFGPRECKRIQTTPNGYELIG